MWTASFIPTVRRVPSTFKAATFEEIEQLRASVTNACEGATSVESAAGAMTEQLFRASASCVLARVFLVLPLKRLPFAERTWVEIFAKSINRTADLMPTTPVLSLLGTTGTDYTWNDRGFSVGHRAIPLIDKSFVHAAPMIAAALTSFNVDVGMTNDGEIALRTASGGLNARFFVSDAQTTVDKEGRFVIASRDFVEKNAVRSVFGMGGSYVNGELAVAIVFTRELMNEADVDRYTSLISSFKMATSALMSKDRIYAGPSPLPSRR